MAGNKAVRHGSWTHVDPYSTWRMTGVGATAALLSVQPADMTQMTDDMTEADDMPSRAPRPSNKKTFIGPS